MLNSRILNIKALVSSAGSQSCGAQEVQEREKRRKERGGSCSPREVPAQLVGLLVVMAERSPSALPREPTGSISLPTNSQLCKVKSRALSEKGNLPSHAPWDTCRDALQNHKDMMKLPWAASLTAQHTHLAKGLGFKMGR